MIFSKPNDEGFIVRQPDGNKTCIISSFPFVRTINSYHSDKAESFDNDKI